MALLMRKRAHFVAVVIEDGRLPIGMKTLARIGVLVEMRAVEVGQPVLVVGKVRWHPVEDDADAALVQVVDQVHEILRRAETRAGREIAGDLISPGAEEGMLHHGHEFDVGEAHLVDVVGQLHRQLAIAERAVALFRHAHPRAKMHLVGRHGRVEFVVLVARTHPLVVAPFVLGVPDDRRGARRTLVVEGERVSLVDRDTCDSASGCGTCTPSRGRDWG